MCTYTGHVEDNRRLSTTGVRRITQTIHAGTLWTAEGTMYCVICASIQCVAPMCSVADQMTALTHLCSYTYTTVYVIHSHTYGPGVA